MKVALITGITGQDGSYLAELLLEKGMKYTELKEGLLYLILIRIDHLYQDPHDPKSTIKVTLWRFNRCNEFDTNYYKNVNPMKFTI